MTRLTVRSGNAGESYVQRTLQALADVEGVNAWVLHLSPNGPADLVVLRGDGRWKLVEVKTSRRRARARKAALSEPEGRLRAEVVKAGFEFDIWRLHRSGQRFEVLAIEDGHTEVKVERSVDARQVGA